ncbi:MAG: reverse transcriptase domain-containing protein, partial [Chloroflexota bacterium]|nr:reverse transcriptase domain-containing protein [Chloroflexota bacterium]
MSESLLYKATTIDNLRLAWEEIAENKGIAGVDNVSIRKWRRTWEERIVRLSHQARTNTYKPRPLRVRKIPKRNRREWRVLRIPTVTDRILMRAVLQVLYPILEDKFLDCSFGYRPGIGLKDAVNRILILRVNEYNWVLDADIDDYFNQVDQHILMSFLHEDLPDQSLFHLIRSWLKVGRPDPQNAKGIPMGSPLSPVLANVFLHRLDQKIIWDGYRVVRYADDFLVFAQKEKEIHHAY